MFFTRPGELRNAEWSRLILTKRLELPRTSEDETGTHRTALPQRWNIDGTEEVDRASRYVFPRALLRAANDNNAVNAALRRMGTIGNHDRPRLSGNGADHSR